MSNYNPFNLRIQILNSGNYLSEKDGWNTQGELAENGIKRSPTREK